MPNAECDSSRTLFEYVRVNKGDEEAAWSQIVAALPRWDGQPILGDWGIEKLRAGLGGHLRAVLVEPHYICKDHRDLFSHYYSRKFHVNPGICGRLHFFSNDPGGVPALLEDPAEHQEGYLGYAVIRPVPKRCLGRSVFSVRKLGLGYGSSMFCLSTPFKVHINGIELKVRGYPYMSQDNEAMVCAHAALWGICRYLSERYSAYREVHPFDLVKMTGKDFGRAYPRRGMVYRDYSTILTDFGTYPVIVDAKKHVADPSQQTEALRDIFTYVESGFPVLLSVRKAGAEAGHALTAMGHTLNDALGKPDADGIVDHTAFFDHLVVMDDNEFPYRLLAHEPAPGGIGPVPPAQSKYTCEDIHTAVCPLPEKVFITADVARLLLRKHLMDPDVWSEIQTTGKAPWVSRLFLTTGYSFKRAKLKAAREWPLGAARNLDYIVGLSSLPHFIWVMEVGPRALYSQRTDRTCTAEIVLDATAGKNDYRAILYARVGRKLFFPESSKPYECDDAKVAFKLYRHNLGEDESDDLH